MTTTYTPGPWVYDTSEDGAMEIHNADYSLFIARRHRMNDRDEAIANARLIAAAPDLLAALDALTISILQNCCEADYANMPGLKKYVYRARAAIAKARGED